MIFLVIRGNLDMLTCVLERFRYKINTKKYKQIKKINKKKKLNKKVNKIHWEKRIHNL